MAEVSNGIKPEIHSPQSVVFSMLTGEYATDALNTSTILPRPPVINKSSISVETLDTLAYLPINTEEKTDTLLGKAVKANDQQEHIHTSHESSTRNRFLRSKIGKVVAAASGAVAFFGAGAALKPSTAEGRLNLFGAPVSSNLSEANRQLDWYLDKRGDCNPMVDALAKVLGFRTKAARDKYLNADNLDLVKRFNAKNRTWKTSTGAKGCESQTISNRHRSSPNSFVVGMHEIPNTAQARAVTRYDKKKGMFVFSTASLRGECGFQVMTRKRPKKTRERVRNQFEIDVSHGVAKALVAAAAKARSESTSEVHVTCPDGTTVNSTNYALAKSNSLALAAAKTSKRGTVVIKSSEGTGRSFVAVERSFNNRVIKLIAAAESSAETETRNSLVVKCATSPAGQQQPGLIGPDAEIRPIEHTIESGTNTVCGSATDDKGIKRVDFVKGSPTDPISISSTFQPDAVNTPHKYCATITAAQVETDTPVKMTMIATDTDNLQSNTLDPRASSTFTVKDREF